MPGDKLRSTNAAQHSIEAEPGTAPINTRPYRLPEAQKAEIENQVGKLLNEGIIEESNSPWNSTLLVVPKKVDASGEKNGELSSISENSMRKRSDTPIPSRTYPKY
jgi:hypothetical protein